MAPQVPHKETKAKDKTRRSPVKKVMVYKHPDGLGSDVATKREIELCMKENMDRDGGQMESTQKIFVGGLSWGTTAETLTSYFAQFGTVTNSYIIMDPDTGKSRGFGFVEFSSTRAVDLILSTSHFMIDGRAIECKPSYSRSHATSYHERRVKVTNLPLDCSQKEVIDYFAIFGKIEHAEFDCNKSEPMDATGAPAGGKKCHTIGSCTAYITYSGKSGINRCISEGRWIYRGRKLHVTKALIRDKDVDSSNASAESTTCADASDDTNEHTRNRRSRGNCSKRDAKKNIPQPPGLPKPIPKGSLLASTLLSLNPTAITGERNSPEASKERADSFGEFHHLKTHESSETSGSSRNIFNSLASASFSGQYPPSLCSRVSFNPSTDTETDEPPPSVITAPTVEIKEKQGYLPSDLFLPHKYEQDMLQKRLASVSAFFGETVPDPIRSSEFDEHSLFSLQMPGIHIFD